MGDSTDRTGMVRVELSPEEWEQRSAKLAEDEQARFDLIDKKQTHNRKWNEELIQLRDSIKVLTEEVNTRQAWVPAQTGMFEGGASNDADEPADEEAEEAAPPAGRSRRRGRRGNGATTGAVA